MIHMIGMRLKTIRKNKNITLKQLSEKTNLSIGLLSNVERNLRSPSITNLHKICNALDITINEILEQTDEKLYVKSFEREVIFNENDSGGNVKYESLVSGDRNLKAMAQIIKDDKTHDSFKHNTDEIGFIISGEVLICVEDNEYILSSGDTIYIPANYSHYFKKLSNEECIIYWVSTNNN